MLRLPRTNLAPEAITQIEAFIDADLRPIAEANPVLVSHRPLGSELQECLQITLRTGCITQGLETITKVLDDEKKGLVEVQKRTEQVPGQRMSRFLFISNDGSERFYRQVAALLKAHGDRVGCVRLDASSSELGTLLGARGNPAKAALIHDKKALGLFFTELARVLVMSSSVPL